MDPAQTSVMKKLKLFLKLNRVFKKGKKKVSSIRKKYPNATKFVAYTTVTAAEWIAMDTLIDSLDGDSSPEAVQAVNNATEQAILNQAVLAFLYSDARDVEALASAYSAAGSLIMNDGTTGEQAIGSALIAVADYKTRSRSGYIYSISETRDILLSVADMSMSGLDPKDETVAKARTELASAYAEMISDELDDEERVKFDFLAHYYTLLNEEEVGDDEDDTPTSSTPAVSPSKGVQ